MLLAIDVGNSQTHIGVFSDARLVADWRISTNPSQTSDELAVKIAQLLLFESMSMGEGITGVIIASVVPSLTVGLRAMAEKYFGFEPLVVGPGIRSGIPILTDNPKEVGADRVVNCAAALSLTSGPLIVIDFGTATTFDAISEKGEYLGGVICPGVQVSAAALSSSAALLPRVELAAPEGVIGKSTNQSIRSGVILGAACLADGMIARMSQELGNTPQVLATGGLAPLIIQHCLKSIRHVAALTLLGLRILYERNV